MYKIVILFIFVFVLFMSHFTLHFTPHIFAYKLYAEYFPLMMPLIGESLYFNVLFEQ